MKWIERNLLWILTGLGVLMLLGAIAQVISSLPPNHYTFVTGREGGAYYLGAQLYQKVAASDGFTVKIVPTAGSVEALKMLEEGKGDVAFIQGGIAGQGDPEKVSALATVGYEPVWIFYRRELASGPPLDTPMQLKGRRVAIGETGSGTNQLARQVLADYELSSDNTTLLEVGASAALEQLKNGEIDATFLVANTVAPVLSEYLKESGLELMSMADAEALARRHRFLTVLSLPRGTFDLVNVRPREDVKLVSTIANLVVRNNLHPDLLRLLAFSAVELHGPGGFFAPRNFFPSLDYTDLPVSKEGETYLERIKNREFMLDRYLPFWISAVFDRYLLFVVPIALILLPMLARSPLLYQIYMRRKVNHWYKDMHEIERDTPTMNVAELDAALAELEEIDHTLVHEISVSNTYMPNLYDLRTHLAYVANRLKAQRVTLVGATATSDSPVTSQ